VYQQPHYQPAHYQPPVRQPSAGLAIASLVLGIVGVVLSFMPIVNNLTAAGAIVGFVLGMIGIWKSKPVMSGIAVFLCGTAVALTVMAQVQLSRELDEIDRKFQQDMEQIEQLDEQTNDYFDCLDSYGDDTARAMLECGQE
jgi:hypothetical protein